MDIPAAVRTTSQSRRPRCRPRREQNGWVPWRGRSAWFPAAQCHGAIGTASLPDLLPGGPTWPPCCTGRMAGLVTFHRQSHISEACARGQSPAPAPEAGGSACLCSRLLSAGDGDHVGGTVHCTWAPFARGTRKLDQQQVSSFAGREGEEPRKCPQAACPLFRTPTQGQPFPYSPPSLCQRGPQAAGLMGSPWAVQG